MLIRPGLADERVRLSHHSPLEGESQKPSREAKADAVGGSPLRKADVLCSSPHRRACGLAPLPCRLPLKGGVMGQKGVMDFDCSSLSVLALGAGSAELAAVFLLDGLQAGFADFAVFFGHVGFGDFSTAITDHGLSLSLCRSGCLLLPTRWVRGVLVCYPWRTGLTGTRHPR